MDARFSRRWNLFAMTRFAGAGAAPLRPFGRFTAEKSKQEGMQVRKSVILLSALAPFFALAACGHMADKVGEKAAGAEESIAAPSLTPGQKQAGIVTLNRIAREFLDAQKLYTDAANLAKNAEFKSALRQLASERGDEANDVEGHVRELGGTPDTSATPGSSIAGAWMKLKTVVESDTKAAVQQVLAHEDAIISTLNSDMSDADLAGSTKDYIKAMRDNVQGDRDRLAGMK
jgi:uncharacterized protein (TIGR02284 family)